MPKEANNGRNPGSSSTSDPKDNEDIQRTVLRRLFREPVFNQPDGLDDYDADFKLYHDLEDIIMSDMRGRMEKAVRDEPSPGNEPKEKPPEMGEPVSTEQKSDKKLPGMSRHSIPPLPLKLHSTGKIVIVGDPDRAVPCVRHLQGSLTCALLNLSGNRSENSGIKTSTIESAPAVQANAAKIEGAFTRFTVSLQNGSSGVTLDSVLGNEWRRIDLILDLQPAPFFSGEHSRPEGYFTAGDDENELEEMLHLLAEMKGEFEKDISIAYDPARCCHSSRGIHGCSRCIDTCPAGAVKSGSPGIEIDHLLCRGCGICSLECPGGALTFINPGIDHLLEGIKKYLEHPADADRPEISPFLVIHETDRNPFSLLPPLPDDSGPFYSIPLESVGIAGTEIWLAALASGFCGVAMYLPPETDPVTVSGVEKAVGITGRMLEGIGMAGDCISVMKSPEDFAGFSFSGGRGIKRSAGRDFISEAMKDSHDKRTLILKSLQILYDHSGAASGRVELPPEAHFAGIRISKEKCTLCMACAAVCPVGALTAGTDHPRLNFCEAACTSCGICMKACPEKAIDLVPGIPLPPEEAWAERVLGEEPPFLCIQCGKSFAAQATISRITDKLRDHWMYRDPEAVNRLRMCRDCRISDYFSRDSGQLFE